MRCCEAWKPVGKCFDPISLESIDFQRLSQIIANSTRESFAERDPEIRNLPWTQTEKDKALARCRLGLRAWRVKKNLFFVSTLSLMMTVIPWKTFAESRTVCIPKTSDIDDNGRIVRSPDGLRPLTLCNCDSKLLTSAICRGLHWHTMRCIHPSHRCISSRQMTDNIFEIETTALAHVACTPQESGILLTDFAAAYPSVNQSWIPSVLEKTELPEFICRFLRSIKNDITTHVESAGATLGQFLLARGVRQGCPGSGFLFAMAFDLIFRWLQEAVIPRNPDNLDFLQPTQCAYADDLVVASFSYRGLMTALALAFHSVDHIAGLNLNYRKCCLGDANFQRCQARWNHDRPRWLHSSLDGTPEKIIQRVLKNQCFNQKPG